MMSSSSILNIGEKVIFDDGIESVEYHTYVPYNNVYGNNDEIRICVNSQDLIVQPSESFLVIEGSTKDITLVNNCMAFLFQNIRYELNGVEIDRSKNCGISTTMKGILSYGKEESNALENSGWNLNGFKDVEAFSFNIPLRHLLGFAEDYKKVIVHAKHELILNRSSTDINCAIKNIAPIEVTVKRIAWRLPVIKVSDKEKLQLLSYVENNISIPIAFRSWDLYEYPMLPASHKNIWNVKTSTQLEKPRYVILGFQHARNNEPTKNMSEFDHSNFHNARLYLNSQYYPYDSFECDFEKGTYSLLYEAFADFKRSYYGINTSNIPINPAHFKTKTPLIVFDCSRQNDSFRSNGGGAIDIKLEMEFKKVLTTNVTAYCLIIYDSLFEYNILTSVVRKINS